LVQRDAVLRPAVPVARGLALVELLVEEVPGGLVAGVGLPRDDVAGATTPAELGGQGGGLRPVPVLVVLAVVAVVTAVVRVLTRAGVQTTRGGGGGGQCDEGCEGQEDDGKTAVHGGTPRPRTLGRVPGDDGHAIGRNGQ